MSEKRKVCSARNDVNSFKKMVRLLDWCRRSFLEADWKEHAGGLQKGQYIQLMLIRFIMPCNLGRIMAVTGLTSAGASLFVDKLVQQGFLLRTDDPDDRRSVRIQLTEKGRSYLQKVDDRLNKYIFSYFDTCTEEELQIIGQAADIIDARLSGLEKTL